MIARILSLVFVLPISGTAVIAKGAPLQEPDPMISACDALARLSPAPPASESNPLNAQVLADHFHRAHDVGYSGGIVVATSRHTLLDRHYGLVDRRGVRTLDSNSVIDIGSVSKQFTAAAIVKLAELGRLSFSDRLAKYFPDAPADKRAITIHQLLTHTAGFAHDAISRDLLLNRDEAMSRMLASKLLSAPGADYIYSNAGYSILAAIVDKLSPRGYERFLRDALFGPAGMTQTGMILPKWWAGHQAYGYDAGGASPPPFKQWWIADGVSWSARGAAGLWSTPADLIRWARALRTNRVLNERSRTMLFHPWVREKTKAPSYYTYGWTVSYAPDGGCRIEHDGGGGFHYDVVQIYPRRDLYAVMYATESRGPYTEMMDEGRSLILSSRTSKLPVFATHEERDLNGYVGVFRARDIDLLIEGGAEGLFVRTNRSGVLRLLTPFAPTVTSPALQEDNAILAIFDALARGDSETYLQTVGKNVNRTEERVFIEDQWPKWLKRFGSYVGSELIGRGQYDGGPKAFVLVKFARGALPVEFSLNGDGSMYLNTVTYAFPERLRLIPQGGGRFIVYNASFRRPVLLTLDRRKMTAAVEAAPVPHQSS